MADSTLKSLFLPLFLVFLCAASIPQEYQPKCTIAENQLCFSNATTACRKGEHVNNRFTECTPVRPCCPCSRGTFQPYSNLCDSCIECKDCAKKNRKVESPCNSTHDAICGEELPKAVTTQPPETSPPPEDQTTEAAVTNPPSDQNAGTVWCHPVFLLFSHTICAGVTLLAFIMYQKRSDICAYMSRVSSNWRRRASIEEGLEPRPQGRPGIRESPGNRRGTQSS